MTVRWVITNRSTSADRESVYTVKHVYFGGSQISVMARVDVLVSP